MAQIGALPRRTSMRISVTFILFIPWAAQSQDASGVHADAAASSPVPANASSAFQPVPSRAADARLEEIVVPAEKRATNIQRTPIAVTAISGKDLQNEQVHTLTDIVGLVPSFKMGDNSGFQQITIRGVGITNFTPGADSTVSVNVNEVNISRPVAQATSLYDVSQLEVLRGPQGTLYGRNSSAGTVNIVTALPTDMYSGYGRALVANFGDLNVEGAVGGPIIEDKLLFRVAGFAESREGYGKNIGTGNRIDNRRAAAVRATLVLKPAPDFKGTLIAEQYGEKDRGAGLHYFGPGGQALGIMPFFLQLGGYAARSPWDIASLTDPEFRLTTTAVTGILNWDRAPFSVKSITGYRKQTSQNLTPLTGGVAPNFIFYVDLGDPAHQLSEELQFHYDGQSFHGTVGLYYFHEYDNYTPGTAYISGLPLNILFGGTRPPGQLYRFVDQAGLLQTTSKAVFGDGTYDIGYGVSLTAGIRFSHELKSFDQGYSFTPDQLAPGVLPPNIPQPSHTYTSSTPKLGIQYQIDPRSMVYATYAKGFKAGGYDPGTFPATPFLPERLIDYEVGLKSTWLGGLLRTNIQGFYYDYTNLQVQEIVGLSLFTANAATARVYGQEFEFSALPTDALSINGSLSWLHARYVGYSGPDPALPGIVDFSGKTLNNAPDLTAHLSAEYSWHVVNGTFALRGEADYSSRFFFYPDNIPLLGQSAYVRGSAFLTYKADRNWYSMAFVRNISNIAVRSSGLINSLGSPEQGSYAPPRTYGIELGYRF